MARKSALLVALVLSLLGGGVALGASGLIVADTTVDALRAADGSLSVTVQVANPTDRMSQVAIRIGTCSATGSPVVEPMSSSDVHFDVEGCPTELGPVGAELTAALVASTGEQSSAGPVPLTLTVKDPATTDWSALLWFLTGFGALLAVVPPYVTWLAFPLGNATPRARFHWADGCAIVRKLWSRDLIDHLDRELPGISADWNFKDTWASNVGLAASVFTGVFAAAGPLGELVGAEARSTLALVAVASALSAALIGSGPLWLTILKRRTEGREGYARYNTVGGVLVASFVVYFATIGLIATVVHVTIGIAPGGLVALLGVSALSVSMLYAWKSIPQTLGLGSIVVKQGAHPEQRVVARQLELAQRPSAMP